MPIPCCWQRCPRSDQANDVNHRIKHGAAKTGVTRPDSAHAIFVKFAFTTSLTFEGLQPTRGRIVEGKVSSCRTGWLATQC
jgi:heterodisulfide reductase subunit C